MKSNAIKEKSFSFALEIVAIYKYLCFEKREFVLSKQILRSGTSIGANIREAEHAESKADFIHKLSIALKEANETEYWLDLLYQSEYLTVSQFQNIKNQITQQLKLLTSIINTTKNKNQLLIINYQLKNMKGPLFYSKILLFGEYGIIKDSKGLSIPYNFYNGALKSDENSSEEALKSNQNLGRFVSYLEKLQNEQPDLVTFDLTTLKKDVSGGMYFDSSIPQGYGVGSSGALVAAIYDKYAQNKITVLENLTREKLLQLKTIFGQMESFFHGKSSGLDPLNSYLSIPILINSQDNIEATGIPTQSLTGKGAVFLLDSGIVGETAPMVNIFMENLKDQGFRTMLKTQFIKHTDACVENFLGGDIKSLFANTKKLSKVVLSNFKPMIPEQFHGIWQKGIDTNDYYLKLCGSGGGGYILGFTEDLEKAKISLKDYKLEVVYQF